MGSNPVVSAPTRASYEERLRALDLLVVADFFLSETAALADVVLPSAQWAEEDGTMTNLEGRVILRRRAMDPPPGVRTDSRSSWPSPTGSVAARTSRFVDSEAVFDELRRATAGGVADYAGITYEKIEARRGCSGPAPTEEHTGTAAHLRRRASRRRVAARAFTPCGTRHRRGARRTTTRSISRPASAVAVPVGNADAPRRAARAPRARAVAEINPHAATRARIADGALVTLTTRRGSSTARAAHARHPRRHRVRAVPLGRRGSINRLTNPALDPTSRMPEFKVCAVRIEPQSDRKGAKSA
jgi:assimilatory nitrate reductase catalytic subunit